ncbi:MAG TPA: lytic murein transglycosylase [Stellaceae bacterium]|jgi:membrane-bound lytic murein transglycosylase B|nr:lytic murein transglycosylase [Stellaceae bacterium]
MMPRRYSRRLLLSTPLIAAPALLAGLPAAAAEEDFYAFLSTVGREAAAQGVRSSTIDLALRYAQYLPHVIELDRHQPEQVLTFAQYLQKTVSPQRVENARRQLYDNWVLLDAVWRRYDVEPRFIVALWGMESDFGAITGNYMVVSSLATLGFDGRRGPYFRGELISALRIIDEGNVGVGNMTGSWAGAMGQCQFMPSTFLRYAVDYDRDGRRDIWNNRADVLGSIANFLAHLGWRNGESWGRQVLLPAGFDERWTGLDFKRPTGEWSRMGVRGVDARPLAAGEVEASLVMPDGADGPALLVYDNFRTIMRWNKSTYFAAAVGYLADSMQRGARIEHG